jgi:hypothetical protein
VHDEGEVAKEGGVGGVGREEGVGVSVGIVSSVLAWMGCVGLEDGYLLSGERALGDVTVLAAQVTNLAGLGLGRIARRSLATQVRVEVSAGTSAVAVGRNWLGVNV